MREMFSYLFMSMVLLGLSRHLVQPQTATSEIFSKMKKISLDKPLYRFITNALYESTGHLHPPVLQETWRDYYTKMYLRYVVSLKGNFS